MSVRAATDLSVKLLRDQGPEWDQPNRLYLLYRDPLGSFDVDEVPVPPPLAHQDPVALWAAFVRMVAFDIANPARPRPALPAPVGAACVVEAWQAPESHAVEIARRRQAGGSIPHFSEMPGRKEVRVCTVCLGSDVGGAQDIRGEGIDVVTTREDAKLQGRVVDSLRAASDNLVTLLGPDHAAATARAEDIIAQMEKSNPGSTQGLRR